MIRGDKGQALDTKMQHLRLRLKWRNLSRRALMRAAAGAFAVVVAAGVGVCSVPARQSDAQVQQAVAAPPLAGRRDSWRRLKPAATGCVIAHKSAQTWLGQAGLAPLQKYDCNGIDMAVGGREDLSQKVKHSAVTFTTGLAPVRGAERRRVGSGSSQAVSAGSAGKMSRRQTLKSGIAAVGFAVTSGGDIFGNGLPRKEFYHLLEGRRLRGKETLTEDTVAVFEKEDGVSLMTNTIVYEQCAFCLIEVEAAGGRRFFAAAHISPIRKDEYGNRRIPSVLDAREVAGNLRRIIGEAVGEGAVIKSPLNVIYARAPEKFYEDARFVDEGDFAGFEFAEWVIEELTETFGCEVSVARVPEQEISIELRVKDDKLAGRVMRGIHQPIRDFEAQQTGRLLFTEPGPGAEQRRRKLGKWVATAAGAALAAEAIRKGINASRGGVDGKQDRHEDKQAGEIIAPPVKLAAPVISDVRVAGGSIEEAGHETGAVLTRREPGPVLPPANRLWNILRRMP